MQKLFIGILTFLLTATIELRAQTILQMKGKQALLEIPEFSVKEGDLVFAKDANGQRVGQLRIKKVKKNRAIADLVKGRAEAQQEIEVRSQKAKNSRVRQKPPVAESSEGLEQNPGEGFESEKSSSSEAPMSRSGKAFGALLGYSLNSLQVRSSINVNGTPTAEDLDLQGSSITLKGFYDLPLNPAINLRFLGGLEPFEVKGSPSAGREVLCGGTKDCSIKFTYLSFEGQGQLNLLNEKNRLYGSLGYSFLFAISNSGNVAAFDSSVKTNHVITGSLGFDLRMKRGSFMPFNLDYNFYPTGGDVKASAIHFRVGYAMDL